MEEKKVYVVTVSYECGDNYYPDYVSIYAVVSTKEKAQNLVARLYDEHRDSYEPELFTEARFFEMTLDQLPEKRQ